MYYVYVLYSKAHLKIYIGSTSNLEGRLQAHNHSANKGWIRSFQPWIIIYNECFTTKSVALRIRFILQSTSQGLHWHHWLSKFYVYQIIKRKIGIKVFVKAGTKNHHQIIIKIVIILKYEILLLMKKALLTISILLTAINCFTQTIEDTLIAPINYVEKTDSIQVKTDTAMLIQNLLIPLYVPDSVYIKRLSALPFELKMTYNPVVRRYIELYTVKIKDKLQVIIGLSDFYFPIIDEIFSAYHLPKELRYLSIIESALNPQAVSRAHAVGLWQFMKGTGKENGLTINNYVDTRRGIVESTKAAAKYLTLLYSIYHD